MTARARSPAEQPMTTPLPRVAGAPARWRRSSEPKTTARATYASTNSKRLGPTVPRTPRTSMAAVAPVTTKAATGAAANMRRAVSMGERLTTALRRIGALAELFDEALELAQVAAFVDAVAVDAVLGDDRVPGVPIRTRLGIEPVDVPGPLPQLLHDPRLGGVVVVPGVAEEDHRALRRHLGPPPVPEDLKSVAVVGVPVDPDDVGLGVHPVHGLVDVVGALEEAGHLVDAV